MARPERNSVDYFPFICAEGKKMFTIEQKYGNDGFATFIKILRALANTEYHFLNLSEPSEEMFLSAKCNVSNERLNSIIIDLVKLGKFNPTLWNENKIIWCQDFIDSVQDAYKKRNNKCITLDGLLILLDGLGIRKLSKSNLQVPVKPQRKEKDIKEKKSIEKEIPPFSEFLLYAKEKEPSVLESALKNKYDAWIENNWRDGNNHPIQKWKVKLLNTMPFIEKEKSSAKKESFIHTND